MSTLRAKAEAQEENLVPRKSNRVLKLTLVPPMVWPSVLRRATIISGLVWMGFRELEIPGRAIFQAEKLSLQHKIRPECVCISGSVPMGTAETRLLYPLWCFVGTQTTRSTRSALLLLYFQGQKSLLSLTAAQKSEAIHIFLSSSLFT